MPSEKVLESKKAVVAEITERLKNAQVFRTDYDGDIKFIIHKNGSAETDIYNRR